MFTEVYYADRDTYPIIVFVKPATEDDPATETHIIPMQAIADRMELYGFESVEQTLEYIGLEAHNFDVSDTLHEGIQNAYREVVESEFAQSLMPNPRTGAVGRQTLLAPMDISPSKREKLREVRGESLQILGMASVIHSEPMSRVMDTSRPVERTRPAAAQALGASENSISQAVSLVQERLEEIQAWRASTAGNYVPHLRTYLEQLADSEKNR